MRESSGWGKMPIRVYAGFSPDPVPRTYTGSDNTYIIIVGLYEMVIII